MKRQTALTYLLDLVSPGPFGDAPGLTAPERAQVAKVAKPGETPRQTLCRITHIDLASYGIASDALLFVHIRSILDEEYPL